jgi:hypothetical protein
MVGVVTLGVDEHIWKPSHHGGDRAVTSMVDLTRDSRTPDAKITYPEAASSGLRVTL